MGHSGAPAGRSQSSFWELKNLKITKESESKLVTTQKRIPNAPWTHTVTARVAKDLKTRAILGDPPKNSGGLGGFGGFQKPPIENPPSVKKPPAKNMGVGGFGGFFGDFRNLGGWGVLWRF